MYPTTMMKWARAEHAREPASFPVFGIKAVKNHRSVCLGLPPFEAGSKRHIEQPDVAEDTETPEKIENPTADQIGARARQVLYGKLDTLSAKDLKEIVVEDLKLQQAQERSKQMGKATPTDDGLAEKAAAALGHRRDRLRVV